MNAVIEQKLTGSSRNPATVLPAAHRVVRLPSSHLCGHDQRHWYVAAVLELPAAFDGEAAKQRAVSGEQ